MVNYKVTVSTADYAFAGTLSLVYIKLVGTDGESERTWLRGHKDALPFADGAVSTFTVSCHDSLGELLLIELQKEPLPLFPEDSWFPLKVEVKAPGGFIYNFPIYGWIKDDKVHRFREGAALRSVDDSGPQMSVRKQEMEQRQEDYQWEKYSDGVPECLKAPTILSLPSELRFSFEKDAQFFYTLGTGYVELGREGVLNNTNDWSNIRDIERVFPDRQTEITDYARAHWKEDAFFGYQCLNGINPMMVQRCSALPDNLPVTDDMVFPGGQYQLADEMKKGNIFLCDYKILDGLKGTTISKKEQYLTAPLVLLHKTPKDTLVPIAIQLKQTPADDNPIFLPSDSEHDWLTAKIFARSADFNVHEIGIHLLRTHLLAEAFAVSLLRNLPMVHPLYKLLLPHTYETVMINLIARNYLISETGALQGIAAAAGGSLLPLLRRSLSSVTYSYLCIPDNIAERGLEDVPNFYYRDDGLKLWEIIHRFVEGMLKFYYNNDDEVQNDSELQQWISEIFEHGFLSLAETGIPKSFTTLADLTKFVTMVIFTCSAQHTAVNRGQYDYDGWMPNAPSTLEHPPPTKKGTTSEATMMHTLPDQGTTGQGMEVLYLLSQKYADFVPLGQYPDEQFTERIPRQLIKAFQKDLKDLSNNIKKRNANLEIPYTYLDPENVANSVAI